MTTNKHKGRATGGYVSGIPFWPWGEPGPELLVIPDGQKFVLPDPTPDPDAAKVRLALAAEDIQRAIDNVTLATKDDPRLDEALDIYRERLRGIRAALETEAR